MNENNEQISKSTGYLLVERQETHDRHARTREAFFEEYIESTPANEAPSFANQSWYQVKAIKVGDVIKISAVHHDARVEGSFKTTGPTVRRGGSGEYEIRGDHPFKGKGQFKNVAGKQRDDASFKARDNGEYQHFFLCHSDGGVNNGLFLRWRIALREFSKVENDEQE